MFGRDDTHEDSHTLFREVVWLKVNICSTNGIVLEGILRIVRWAVDVH